ncbi:hypothetical protein H2200_001164 [Cladophialophora chaetospira]|uniref:Uncharacterized protein n=1 Tax=Cladophialophora chaetospira TaxID=386627 RepID=A0AA38XKM0_9EURO|nr:hypothetical protein H2200_001164 [Cladophialophora chaetospira]
MSYGPYQDGGFGHQGQRPTAPRPREERYRATSERESQNDLPFIRVSGTPYQQPPRPLNPPDPRHAQEPPPWQYPAQDFEPSLSPELPPSHSSGSVRTDRLDAENQREKLQEDTIQRVKEYYENRIAELCQAQQEEAERTQQRHEHTVEDIIHQYEKKVKDLTQNGAELRRENWILEAEVFGKAETTTDNEDAETYQRLTEEFTSLGLAAEMPIDGDQEKASDRRTMPLCQNKLLSLHVSYVQRQMDRHDNIPADEVEALSEMINHWDAIGTLEWRQAYSLWCTVLLRQGDKNVEFRMRDIWPQNQTAGETSDVRLWSFQIGDELCNFLCNSHADHAEAGIILRKRLLKEMEAQKQLIDPTLRARLHEDMVRTGLSLAQSYLDQANRLPHSNADKRRSLRRDAMEKLEEIWNKNKEQRHGLTPTILTVGQELGCLLYTYFLEEKADTAKEVLESVWVARKANLPQNLEDTLLTGHHLFLMDTHFRNFSEAKLVFEEVWKTVQLMPISKLDKSLKFYQSLTNFLRQSLETKPSYSVAADLLGENNDDSEVNLCVEIGMIFFRDERYPEAEVILRQAYNAYKNSRGPDPQNDSDILACGQCLAHAVAAQKRYLEAMALFEECPIEQELQAPGAQQVGKQELHRYGHVLMQRINHEISSRSWSTKVLPWYFQALEVCPGAVQDFFQAPDMHNCARELLLGLVKSRQYDAVESLLGLLKYPDVVPRDMLPFVFRQKLCRCVLDQGNQEMGDRLLKELLESFKWGQDELGAQENVTELGFWLLEESKIEEALRVFENARVNFGKASDRINEGHRLALQREREIPSVILTPEDEPATEDVASRSRAAANRRVDVDSTIRPRLRTSPTTRVSSTRIERGSTDTQRWGGAASGSEAKSDGSASPNRRRAGSDQSSRGSNRKKNGQSPRRKSEPKPVEKPKGLGIFARMQGW